MCPLCDSAVQQNYNITNRIVTIIFIVNKFIYKALLNNGESNARSSNQQSPTNLDTGIREQFRFEL